MCIAVYKEAGGTPVKKRIFKNCWNANDDGAGFAWWDKKKRAWQVRKGFLTFKAFWKAYNKHQFTEADIVICHFRVGTSGDKTGAPCTHPFPISDTKEQLNATSYVAKKIALHNGVVGSGDGLLSDTQVAVRDHISPLWKYAHDVKVLDLLLDLIKFNTNRWLITDNKDVYLYGDWDEGEEGLGLKGVWFSNQGYKYGIDWEADYTRSKENGKWVWKEKTEYQKEQYRKNKQTAASNNNSGNEPTIIYSAYTADEFANAYGQWDWNTYLAKAVENATKEKDNYNVIDEQPDIQQQSVVNSLPTVTGLVDSQGNILWDEEYNSRDDLPLCPNCHNSDYLIDVDQGAVPINNLDADDLLECTKCGATFNHNNGTLLYFNESTKLEYEKAQREAG